MLSNQDKIIKVFYESRDWLLKEAIEKVSLVNYDYVKVEQIVDDSLFVALKAKISRATDDLKKYQIQRWFKLTISGLICGEGYKVNEKYRKERIENQIKYYYKNRDEILKKAKERNRLKGRQPRLPRVKQIREKIIREKRIWDRRICNICHIEKEKEEFPKKGEAYCKLCKANKNKIWYTRNKKSIIDRTKKYRLKNLDKNRVWQKKYKDANKQDIQKRRKIYYSLNRDVLIKKRVKWAKENKEKVREHVRRYYKSEKGKAARRIIDLRHKDKIRDRHKVYMKKNSSELSDQYVRSLLKRGHMENSPEVLETKRIIIKIKRHVKSKSTPKHS